MIKKIIIIVIFFSCSWLFTKAQNVGINTSIPYVNAQLDISSTNQGILIPRIDYAVRPVTTESGMLIYVVANGPLGNNAFYYYNGTIWLKNQTQIEVQTLSIAASNLTISNANTVSLANIAPVQGNIRCSGIYINPFTDHNNCGACGNICTGTQTCQNGTCQ